MAPCSKNFTSEENINLITGEENETKKVPRSIKRRQMKLDRSQNMSKKGKLQSFYVHEKCNLSLLHYKKHYLYQWRGWITRNVTVLAPESCNRDIPTDEEGNFKDNASFPTEVEGELDIYYNSNDGKRATARNKTKNTTTSAGKMIENS